MVLSLLEDAIYSPFGENCTDKISSEWPLSIDL